MLWIDVKWLNLTASKFRNFKQKRPNLWNLSCPLCGDSQTNLLRARGYIFELDGKLLFKCHNCGKSITFSSLLKEVDPTSHREYIMEKFKEHGNHLMAHVPDVLQFVKETEVVEPLTPKAPSIASLPDDHFAKQYIMSRRIPQESWDKLYFVEDFKAYMDKQHPDHGKEELVEKDPRIIWYLTDLKGNPNVICGRALDGNSLRYIKVRIGGEDQARKVFGWEPTKIAETLYILEGELDSLFLKNAVASGDSSLDLLADAITQKVGPMIKPIVLVYDNQPRNREICRQMSEAIKEYHAIVIWPSLMVGKDINEMVLAGTPIQTIEEVMAENTFVGLEALLHFNQWRKA